MVIAALKAGKTVFVEKPLCTNLQEAGEIKQLVASTGLPVFVLDQACADVAKLCAVSEAITQQRKIEIIK